MSVLGRSRHKIAITPITRFSGTPASMADWNSPRLLLWFLFQHPRLFATAICIQVLGWPRFVHFGIASVRPDPDAIDKSDRIPAQLTARYWHHADSNA